MLAAMVAVTALAAPCGRLHRASGVALLVTYPVFLAYVALR